MAGQRLCHLQAQLLARTRVRARQRLRLPHRRSVLTGVRLQSSLCEGRFVRNASDRQGSWRFEFSRRVRRCRTLGTCWFACYKPEFVTLQDHEMGFVESIGDRRGGRLLIEFVEHFRRVYFESGAIRRALPDLDRGSFQPVSVRRCSLLGSVDVVQLNAVLHLIENCTRVESVVGHAVTQWRGYSGEPLARSCSGSCPARSVVRQARVVRHPVRDEQRTDERASNECDHR